MHYLLESHKMLNSFKLNEPRIMKIACFRLLHLLTIVKESEKDIIY
jgi:hypothetical protein